MCRLFLEEFEIGPFDSSNKLRGRIFIDIDFSFGMFCNRSVLFPCEKAIEIFKLAALTLWKEEVDNWDPSCLE